MLKMFFNDINLSSFRSGIEEMVCKDPKFREFYMSDLRCLQSVTGNECNIIMGFAHQQDDCSNYLDSFDFNWADISLAPDFSPILLSKFESENLFVTKTAVLEVHPDYRGLGVNACFQRCVLPELFANNDADSSKLFIFGHHSCFDLAKHFISNGRFFKHELKSNLGQLSVAVDDDCLQADMEFVYEQNAMSLFRSSWVLNPKYDKELYLSKSTLEMSYDKRLQRANLLWEKASCFQSLTGRLVYSPESLSQVEKTYLMRLILNADISSYSKDSLRDYLRYLGRYDIPYASVQVFTNNIMANYDKYLVYEF